MFFKRFISFFFCLLGNKGYAQAVTDQINHTGIDAIVVKPFVPDELFRIILHHAKCYPLEKIENYGSLLFGM